jgi:hypothetical protein
MADQQKPKFSPREFLKARRPEKFSDTIREERPALDRSQLEYHLATITSRSQENDFQRFAHHLCERTICPNIVPQTGPTGGGDSKVDGETYPVAEELALLWHVGVTGEAARERWAFAVSAKEDWAPKLRSDVGKAVATNRGYKKAFFVTNQAVPDRKRAEEEDKLRAAHGLDVRILDRTWILDRVFADRLEDLAIEDLRATALSHQVAVKGPSDSQRERALEEVERRLTEAVAAGRPGAHLAEAAIEAAELARAIERPSDEVVGRFRRAEELAGQHGTSRLQVEASYQLAWTLYWWYEDYPAFIQQYARVESLAKESRNVYDLEQLANLWFCLVGKPTQEALAAAGRTFGSLTATLTTALERLRDEPDRPSTSLQAEAHLAHVALTNAAREGKPMDSQIVALRDILLRSKGLVGFSVETVVEIVTELGSYIRDSSAFDELLETAVSISSENRGEAQGGRLLLKRGAQLLAQKRPADVISVVGRALPKLYQHETRHDVVRAMYLCGCAYDEIGLPWAARGTLLTAASVATNDLWQYGSFTPHQQACYERLKWVELQLGRLPQTLAWHEAALILQQQVAERRGAAAAELQRDASFEMALGRLLLRTQFSDLPVLASLPASLDHLGLPIATDALLFALGHEERLTETAEQIGEKVEDVALRWSSASADGPQADYPELYSTRTVALTSSVLGCQILARCENEECCLDVAESTLAVTESFLATSAIRRAVAYEPSVEVNVRRSDFADDPFSVEVAKNTSRPLLNVRCRPSEGPLSADRQHHLQEAIFQLAVAVLSQCVRFKDPEADLTALFRDERAGDRAVGFSSAIGARGNVLVNMQKRTIDSWLSKAGPTYEMRRLVPWPGATALPASAPSNAASLPIENEYGMDDSFFATLSHASMATISPIRISLWDQAGWHGTVFLWSSVEAESPVLALLFSDSTAARRIFEEWRREHTNNALNISVVRGIDVSSPHSYYVIVSSEPEAITTQTRLITMVSRQCRMDPASSANLDTFLERAKAAGDRYCLAPAYAPKGDPSRLGPRDIYLDLAVPMQKIRVLQAWEVGVHDLEQIVIKLEDNPIIPESVADPPILAVLKRNRERVGK